MRFTDLAWAEGTDAGSDDGLQTVCARAGLDWDEAKEIVDNNDWEAWVEENRQQMMRSIYGASQAFDCSTKTAMNLFMLGDATVCGCWPMKFRRRLAAIRSGLRQRTE